MNDEMRDAMNNERYERILGYLRDIEEAVYRIEERLNGKQSDETDEEQDEE